MSLDLINEIFQVCIIPLLGILTTFLVKYISTKINEISANNQSVLEKKYLLMLNETITNCVIATTQTYVEALKEKNAFTPEAQKEAFNLTFNAVLAILNEDAKEILNSAVGDLNLYISERIEAEVRINK